MCEFNDRPGEFKFDAKGEGVVGLRSEPEAAFVEDGRSKLDAKGENDGLMGGLETALEGGG